MQNKKQGGGVNFTGSYFGRSARRSRERRQHAACRRQHVISEGLSRHGKNFVRKDSETRLKNRIDHAQIVDNPVLAWHRHSRRLHGELPAPAHALHLLRACSETLEHQSLTRTKDFKPKLLIYIRTCECIGTRHSIHNLHTNN